MVDVAKRPAADAAADVDALASRARATSSAAPPRPNHSRPGRRRRNRMIVIAALVVLVAAIFTEASCSCLSVGKGSDSAGMPASGSAPQAAGDAVRNGSVSSDLSGWRVSSDGGHISLTRVVGQRSPAGVATAADLAATSGSGHWAMALIALHQPAKYFRVGHTYRMQLWVRDVPGSDQGLVLVLANQNYSARPTMASAEVAYKDTGWHLVSRTFVATASGARDTCLYVQLPADRPFHYQLTGASVRPVDVPAVPRVDGPPAQVISFDGPAGSPPDRGQWSHDVGGGGWGNGELETYTTSVSNAHLDGAGHLVITARREGQTSADGAPGRYTSARINTKGKVAIQPGSYVESTIDVPVGAGVWSAFWLIGSDLSQVGWPASGELDVMEVAGADTTWVHTAAHMADAADPTKLVGFGWGDAGGSTDLGEDLRARPHTYGVYFDDQTVRFYIDREEHAAVWAQDARTAGWDWPFGKPQNIVLNLAIGAGDPTNTPFPQTMTVGPISVWQGGTPF